MPSSMFGECDTVCGSGMQTRMLSCVCSTTGQPATGCVGDTIESQCCTDYSNCSMYFTPKRNALWEELFFKLKLLLFSWILWRRFHASDNAQWSKWFWNLSDSNPNCKHHLHVLKIRCYAHNCFYFQDDIDRLLANSSDFVLFENDTELTISLTSFFSTVFSVQRLCLFSTAEVILVGESNSVISFSPPVNNEWSAHSDKKTTYM